eukprot:CAMPEP_0172541884 /NCGR_PEP_ID=MMETSP1067-20121228/12614_1 /TAXON_ID=265564 ORGANISM="Thalassiosira punctigera, Strain Tpunct2005C2" /NCGR_SAMPLE_ID=MMETSP1067 /ASSEMBLY_ACC=CAM_ASM_000444 /LENGTH=92 /DNA_ID=CAMNT_0013328011 /DNA_START=154 /DNA_END=432 /DNA_ORIENTATION=+
MSYITNLAVMQASFCNAGTDKTLPPTEIVGRPTLAPSPAPITPIPTEPPSPAPVTSEPSMGSTPTVGIDGRTLPPTGQGLRGQTGSNDNGLN